jgi:hypothetical protein
MPGEINQSFRSQGDRGAQVKPAGTFTVCRQSTIRLASFCFLENLCLGDVLLFPIFSLSAAS